MNMIDLKKLERLPYITKRIYILENLCQIKEVDLEYLFGLLDVYKNKNSGKWFWQKASLTGTVKEYYDNFNMAVDEILRDLKIAEEEKQKEQIKHASEELEKFLVELETNCNIERKKDFDTVKGFLDKNLKIMIIDNLKRIK